MSIKRAKAVSVATKQQGKRDTDRASARTNQRQTTERPSAPRKPPGSGAAATTTIPSSRAARSSAAILASCSGFVVPKLKFTICAWLTRAACNAATSASPVVRSSRSKTLIAKMSHAGAFSRIAAVTAVPCPRRSM